MAFLKIINYVRLRQKNEMDILMGGAVVDTPSRSYPPLLDNAGGVLAFNLIGKEHPRSSFNGLNSMDLNLKSGNGYFYLWS